MLLLLMCLWLLVIKFCGGYNNPWTPGVGHRKIPQEVMVDVINNLGLKLLEIHNQNNDNNIAISPYGAASVLVALAEGLQGDAVYEIEQAAEIPPDLSVIRVGLRDIHRHLKSYFIPEEGFLAGLTLSHDNVSLHHEYEEILRFYGYDISSFNNPLYPDSYTTTGKPPPGFDATTASVTATNADNMSTAEEKLSTTTVTTDVTDMTTDNDRNETTEESTTTELNAITVSAEDKLENAIDIENSTTVLPSSTTFTSSTISILTTITEAVSSTTTTTIPSITTLLSADTPQTTTITTPSSSTTLFSTTLISTTDNEIISATDATTKPEPLPLTLTSEPTSTILIDNLSTTTMTSSTTTQDATLTDANNSVTETTLQTITEPTTTIASGTTSNIETTVSTNMNSDDESSTTSPKDDIAASTTMIVDQDILTSTTEEVTIATSTELSSSSIATITNEFTTTPENPVKRSVRSVLDYVIARYYDDHSITQKPPPYRPRPEPPTFLVNGKYTESNINFMTYDTVLPFLYIAHLNTLALSFPLDSTKYYLLLLLPVDETGINQLICDMRVNTSLKYIIENLRYTHVKAVIPSFMLKGYVILTPTFQKLGIRRVFEPRQADFSTMTNDKEIYVTNIEQAVTVTIRNYVDPNTMNYFRNLHQYDPVYFKADHPFLYFVIDSEIHVTLMAGKVVNPLNSRIR